MNRGEEDSKMLGLKGERGVSTVDVEEGKVTVAVANVSVFGRIANV